MMVTKAFFVYWDCEMTELFTNIPREERIGRATFYINGVEYHWMCKRKAARKFHESRWYDIQANFKPNTDRITRVKPLAGPFVDPQ